MEKIAPTRQLPPKLPKNYVKFRLLGANSLLCNSSLDDGFDRPRISNDTLHVLMQYMYETGPEKKRHTCVLIKF